MFVVCLDNSAFGCNLQFASFKIKYFLSCLIKSEYDIVFICFSHFSTNYDSPSIQLFLLSVCLSQWPVHSKQMVLWWRLRLWGWKWWTLKLQQYVEMFIISEFSSRLSKPLVWKLLFAQLLKKPVPQTVFWTCMVDTFISCQAVKKSNCATVVKVFGTSLVVILSL